MRTYLLVAGGFDMPLTLGSASTFTLGGFGGHTGNKASYRCGTARSQGTGTALGALAMRSRPELTREWSIGVIPGPHCTEEYLLRLYGATWTGTEWEVHFNSSRTGVRLIGPLPLWAREDGGDAGLHPSNIHDNAYAVGALDLTGDGDSARTGWPESGRICLPGNDGDGRVLEGWSASSGDKVRFKLITVEEAGLRRQELFLDNLDGGAKLPALPKESKKEYMPLLAYEEEDASR